jgi:hypothetical protein
MCYPIQTQLSYWPLNDASVSLKGQNLGEEGYPNIYIYSLCYNNTLKKNYDCCAKVGNFL